MSKKTCARCGKQLDQLAASVYNGATKTTLYYCHDDDGDCYGPATWAGYPEFEKEEK